MKMKCLNVGVALLSILAVGPALGVEEQQAKNLEALENAADGAAERVESARDRMSHEVPADTTADCDSEDGYLPESPPPYPQGGGEF